MSATTQALNGDVAVDPEGLSFGAFEGATGFFLRIAEQTAMIEFYKLVSDMSATVGEATILMTINENPGIRQGVLADVLKIKWPSMTKLIRGLDERGMLQRHVSPTDRRAVELHLTPQGEQLVIRAREQMLVADRKALKMLSDNEYFQLLHLLRKVVGREGEMTG